MKRIQPSIARPGRGISVVVNWSTERAYSLVVFAVRLAVSTSGYRSSFRMFWQLILFPFLFPWQKRLKISRPFTPPKSLNHITRIRLSDTFIEKLPLWMLYWRSIKKRWRHVLRHKLFFFFYVAGARVRFSESRIICVLSKLTLPCGGQRSIFDLILSDTCHT